MFDVKKFSGDFYTYIKDRSGTFNGDYDDLFDIYSLKYVSEIVDLNTEEQNKQIAEDIGICKKDSDEPLFETYNFYAYHAYCSIWKSVMNEFSLCELEYAVSVVIES